MTQVTGTAHQSESFFDAAKSLTKIFAERAPDNDENDQFVAENYADLKTAGLISAGVPSDLGGGGASIRELVLRGWPFQCTPTKSLFRRGVGTTKKLLAI